jgi:uncharacterized protein YjeT (DUF2065 family)
MIFWEKNWDTIFNLPGQYEKLAGELTKTLEDDFRRFGIVLSKTLY